MSEWKERMTMKNGKLIMDNYKAEFEEQLKPACAGEPHADREEARLNALIAENLGKVKVDG